ncbi:lysophospholipid acyltransferase family protein [uncultured Kriegella sp.]|uniref:lysophospholipid acyltransferase family protein n=1 Tax=uncultured Kriegella sp. TaxID=1798910 RepID=UPI0030DC9209
MKEIGYNLVKVWIKCALYLYFGKIKISGLADVPKDKPLLFLPNHQSALLDVLLIAVKCNRKPYFLTRSDVFKSNFLKTVFNFFQMIPVYRIRDGRESLKNNQAIFDDCARLLQDNNAILMFPEANHNLQRRVRPLSKGFTRILFNALEKQPQLDIQMVPVGLNYRDAKIFPDRVAVYYGKAIAVQKLYDPEDLSGSVELIKTEVSNSLKTLTTHIDDDSKYQAIVERLDAMGVDYLNPEEVNTVLASFESSNSKPISKPKPTSSLKLLKVLFVLLNFPVWFLWILTLKPRVPEMEFMGTFRFAFALLVYPVYYLLLFGVVTVIWSGVIGLVVVAILFLFNVVHVRVS